MEEETGPVRTDDPGHRCLCVLIKQQPNDTYVDWCGVLVDTTDQPYCSNCEDRHPTAEYNADIVEVTNIYEVRKGTWLT